MCLTIRQADLEILRLEAGLWQTAPGHDRENQEPTIKKCSTEKQEEIKAALQNYCDIN